MDELTVPQVLRRAADAIREHGWCRYENMNDVGALCAYGALGVAVSGSPGSVVNGPLVRLYDASCKALERQLGALVSIWNDHPDRTVDEVLAAFEAAARAKESMDGAATGDSGGQGSDHR